MRPGPDQARAQRRLRQALAQQDGEDDQHAEVEVLDDAQRPAEQPQLARAERHCEVGGGDQAEADQLAAAAAQRAPAQPRQQRQDEPRQEGRRHQHRPGDRPDRRGVQGRAHGQQVAGGRAQLAAVLEEGAGGADGEVGGLQERQVDQRQEGGHGDADQGQAQDPAPGALHESLDDEGEAHRDDGEGAVGVAVEDCQQRGEEGPERAADAAERAAEGHPHPREVGEGHQPRRPGAGVPEEGETGERQRDGHRGGRRRRGVVLAGEHVGAEREQHHERRLGGVRRDGEVGPQRHHQPDQHVERVVGAEEGLGDVVAARPRLRVEPEGPLALADHLAEVPPRRGELRGGVAALVEPAGDEERDRGVDGGHHHHEQWPDPGRARAGAGPAAGGGGRTGGTGVGHAGSLRSVEWVSSSWSASCSRPRTLVTGTSFSLDSLSRNSGRCLVSA